MPHQPPALVSARLQSGRRAAFILDSFAGCPIPDIARLGRSLRQWRREFLGYFETDGANNGGTEAANGLIELHRRIARGLRNLDNYRLRMLLIGGGLTHPQKSRESPDTGSTDASP